MYSINSMFIFKRELENKYLISDSLFLTFQIHIFVRILGRTLSLRWWLCSLLLQREDLVGSVWGVFVRWVWRQCKQLWDTSRMRRLLRSLMLTLSDERRTSSENKYWFSNDQSFIVNIPFVLIYRASPTGVDGPGESFMLLTSWLCSMCSYLLVVFTNHFQHHWKYFLLFPLSFPWCPYMLACLCRRYTHSLQFLPPSRSLARTHHLTNRPPPPHTEHWHINKKV